jgi:hypothetical protein
LGHSAGSVILPGVARALQITQNLLVNLVEGVAVFQIVEIDLVDLIDAPD